MRHDSTATGLLWIGPWVLGFCFFTVLPVSLALWYGFTDYTLLEPPIPVGVDNYARMASDPILGNVLWNTAVFGVLSIVIGTVLSITLAVLLSNPVRFQSFWRAAVFAPSVLPLVALAVIFKLGYDPDVGIANRIIEGALGWAGVRGPN
ncbi:MAG: sugar ABC transporter permease, partial [Planctomycetota bacterium]|nr:sugar ABC transporter permease [Planctomycetota bacterium]